jgi:DNA-binding HxlR family transcriptional regulator
MKNSKNNLSTGCRIQILGIRDTQELISGKWKVPILAALHYTGTMRFMELQRHIGDVAPKVLSKELKDLEMNQLVKRTVCDTQPVTVEYELTAVGHSFGEVIEVMGKWGATYRQTVIRNESKELIAA